MSTPWNRDHPQDTDTQAIIAAFQSSMESLCTIIGAAMVAWQKQQHIILQEFLAWEEEDEEEEDCDLTEGSGDVEVGEDDGVEDAVEGEGMEDEAGTEELGAGREELKTLEECRPGSEPHLQTHLALKDLRRESGAEHVKRWLVDLPQPPSQLRKPEPPTPTPNPASRLLHVRDKESDRRSETATARARKRRFSEQVSPGVRKRARAAQ